MECSAACLNVYIHWLIINLGRVSRHMLLPIDEFAYYNMQTNKSPLDKYVVSLRTKLCYVLI